jgi:hypothetical protein
MRARLTGNILVAKLNFYAKSGMERNMRRHVLVSKTFSSDIRIYPQLEALYGITG